MGFLLFVCNVCADCQHCDIRHSVTFLAYASMKLYYLVPNYNACYKKYMSLNSLSMVAA